MYWLYYGACNNDDDSTLTEYTRNTKRENETMKTMYIAIQCKDSKTGENGTFGFFTRDNITGDFTSETPIFNDLVALLSYLHNNNIHAEYLPLSKLNTI